MCGRPKPQCLGMPGRGRVFVTFTEVKEVPLVGREIDFYSGAGGIPAPTQASVCFHASSCLVLGKMNEALRANDFNHTIA